MKIIIVGQGPFGEKVLDTLIQQGENIVGVFCPKDKRGEAMAAKAESSGVALFRPGKMKDPQVREAYLELKPDLSILALLPTSFPKPCWTSPLLVPSVITPRCCPDTVAPAVSTGRLSRAMRAPV